MQWCNGEQLFNIVDSAMVNWWNGELVHWCNGALAPPGPGQDGAGGAHGPGHGQGEGRRAVRARCRHVLQEGQQANKAAFQKLGLFCGPLKIFPWPIKAIG